MKRLHTPNPQKIITIFLLVAIFVSLCTVTAFAAAPGVNVAQGVNNAFNTYMKPQIKLVVNITVFGLATVVLLVLFVIKLAAAFASYRSNGGRIEWIEPAGLGAGLILAVSAPFWIWGMIGW